MTDPNIDLSLFALIMRADIVVKSVMVLLALFSLFSWTVIFEKWGRLRVARFRMRRFEKRFRNADFLDDFYDKERSGQDNPLSEMFCAGMYEYRAALSVHSGERTDPALRDIQRERIAVAATRIKERVLEDLERRLNLLATISSSAPFIGLFGTVWGIMHSFQGIAESKNTSLAVVAPGIAEALLATGIGLFAAIPALIFYNMFTGHIRVIHNKMNLFGNELPVLLGYKR